MKEINRRTARTGDCGGSLSRQLRPCTCESAKTCRRMVQVGWRNCPRRLTAGLARVCRQPPSREKEWTWPAYALDHHVFADRKKKPSLFQHFVQVATGAPTNTCSEPVCRQASENCSGSSRKLTSVYFRPSNKQVRPKRFV